MTREAPQRNDDVAQSIAVSPAPSTTTRPKIAGSCALQPHMPGFDAFETSGRKSFEV